jgi:hypothetical protein
MRPNELRRVGEVDPDAKKELVCILLYAFVEAWIVL